MFLHDLLMLEHKYYNDNVKATVPSLCAHPTYTTTSLPAAARLMFSTHYIPLVSLLWMKTQTADSLVATEKWSFACNKSRSTLYQHWFVWLTKTYCHRPWHTLQLDSITVCFLLCLSTSSSSNKSSHDSLIGNWSIDTIAGVMNN